MNPESTHAASRGRTPQALVCDDLSQFAKTLRRELDQHLSEHHSAPGHVQLLNMLARAAGHRNLQTLKATPAAVAAPLAPASEAADLDWTDAELPAFESADAAAPVNGADAARLSPNAAKALSQFDDWGRLARWPHKFSVQRLAMWALWTRFEPKRHYTEREVNTLLKAWTTWGDHVTPRRELVEMKLISREPDCSAYWKNPVRPPEEVQALLRALRARQAAGAGRQRVPMLANPPTAQPG